MAWSQVVTEVVGNPAERGAGRKGRKMAKAKAKRKMSAKQIRHFGTKRQRAALKRKTRSNSGRRGASKKKSHRTRTRPVKRNPVPEILSLTLGNATRGRKMALAKKKRKKAAAGGGRKRNPGTGRKKMSHRRHHRRSNPGQLGSPMEWVQGGAGVLTGVVGTRALPQLFLGANNTGAIGYLSNGVVAAGLGYLAHMFFPRNRVLVGGVIAGGFAALLARVIGDYTSYGKYLSLTGVGDYMVSNWVAPQRLVDPSQAMFEIPNGWGSAPPALAMSSAGVGSTDLAAMGVDMGRRSGVC